MLLVWLPDTLHGAIMSAHRSVQLHTVPFRVISHKVHGPDESDSGVGITQPNNLQMSVSIQLIFFLFKQVHLGKH